MTTTIYRFLSHRRKRPLCRCRQVVRCARLSSAMYGTIRVPFQGTNYVDGILYIDFFPMPSDKTSDSKDRAPPAGQTSFEQHTSKIRHFFSIPAPVKVLFDKVPVLTYPPNDLPQRAPKPARIPSLYVFIKKEDAAAGRPSYNPSCLKWQVSETRIDQGVALTSLLLQTFLNFADINHRLMPSNNHASPSGALPFLLPASKNPQEAPTPITSNKLVKYVEEQGKTVKESSSMRYEAYQSLIDHRIRDAWVCDASDFPKLRSNNPSSYTPSTSSP